MPVIFVLILGIMQGAWFDAEELMERVDIEVYNKPMWQYILYYTTLIFLIIVDAVIIALYRKNTKSSIKTFTTITAYSISGILSIFFAFSI